MRRPRQSLARAPGRPGQHTPSLGHRALARRPRRRRHLRRPHFRRLRSFLARRSAHLRGHRRRAPRRHRHRLRAGPRRHPHAPHRLRRRHYRSRRAPDAAPAPHTLVALERETALEALAAWVEAAGLSPAAFIPADSIVLADAARAALAAANTPDPSGTCAHVVICVGQTTTAVVAATRGRLRLVRTLAIGTESFTDAICRPLRLRPPATPLTLERPVARRLLADVGIPTADQSIDPARGIDGAALLPLLQPVLQRFAVELKQTLRFSLSEPERQAIRLTFLGPGGATPRLAETIAQLAGFDAKDLAALGSPAAACPDRPAHAAINAALNPPVALLPIQTRTQRRLHAMRRTHRVGMLAAATLILLYAASAGFDLLTQNHQTQALAKSAQAAASERTLTERAQAARDAIDGLRLRARDTLVSHTPWAHALAALAEVTPPEITLTAIDCSATDKGEATIVLSGLLPATDKSAVADTLTRYTRQLSAVPIFRAATLGASQRLAPDSPTDSAGASQRFEISLALVPIDADAPASPLGRALEPARAALTDAVAHAEGRNP